MKIFKFNSNVQIRKAIRLVFRQQQQKISPQNFITISVVTRIKINSKWKSNNKQTKIKVDQNEKRERVSIFTWNNVDLDKTTNKL